MEGSPVSLDSKGNPKVKPRQHHLQGHYKLDTVDIGIVQAKDNFFCTVVIFVLQVYVIIVMGSIKATYAKSFSPGQYGYFRDVNIMIFVGFGFLMTFLRRHGLSATGFCFIMSVLCIELSLVWEYFINKGSDHRVDDKYPISLEALLNGLFCSGAVMISLGAVIGKVTPAQLMIMVIIEPIAFWLNMRCVAKEIEAHDVGGGLVIHTFGAYFGLAATWWLSKPVAIENVEETSIYTSDLFSLVGTLFLWCLWPSFQAAVAADAQRQALAITNTFISLCSSCIGFAWISRLLNDHRFDIVHMQNATLAGGVMMGTAGDMDMGVWGAMIAGFCSGVVSCLGYSKLMPILVNKLKIHDTCGVNNLHGMPGIMSGIIAVILAACYKDDPGKDYFYGMQGFHKMTWNRQLGALFTSLGMGIGFGFLTGFLMEKVLPLLVPSLPDTEYYNDRLYFGASLDYDVPAEMEPKMIDMTQDEKSI